MKVGTLVGAAFFAVHSLIRRSWQAGFEAPTTGRFESADWHDCEIVYHSVVIPYAVRLWTNAAFCQ